MNSLKFFIFCIFIICYSSYHIIAQDSPSAGIAITKKGDTISYSSATFKNVSNKYEFKRLGTNEIKKVYILDIAATFNEPAYEYYINEVDEFTKETKKGFSLSMIAGSKVFNTNIAQLCLSLNKISRNDTTNYYIYASVYSLYLRANVVGCSGSGSYLLLKLFNGDVIKIENDLADIDCSEMPISKFHLTDEVIATLRKESIVSARFAQSKGFMDFTLIFPNYLVGAFNKIDAKKIIQL